MATLKGRRWHVQSAVATQGLGLYEGLDWLSSTLKSLHSRGWRRAWERAGRGAPTLEGDAACRRRTVATRANRDASINDAKDSYRFHSRRRGSRRRLRHATSPSITTSPSFTTSSTRRPRCDPRPIPFRPDPFHPDRLLFPPATAPRGSRAPGGEHAIEGRRGRPPPRSPVSCRREVHPARVRQTVHPATRICTCCIRARPLGKAPASSSSSPRRRCRRARRRAPCTPPPRVRAFAST